MIEIEKKIHVTSKLLHFLAEKGAFLGEKTLSDICYDTADFRYTTTDRWLRKRGSSFELKRAVKGKRDTFDRYEEIMDHAQIQEALELPLSDSLESSLLHHKILPFATVLTHRKKYLYDSLTIDVDLADFGEFTYGIAEVEFLVEREDEIREAQKRIDDLLKSLDIDLTQAPQAKLTAYLERYRPDHFKALQAAQVI